MRLYCMLFCDHRTQECDHTTQESIPARKNMKMSLQQLQYPISIPITYVHNLLMRLPQTHALQPDG